MTKLSQFLSRFQLQYHRTSTLHKVVIAVALVLSSMTLFSLRLAQWDAEERLYHLQQQVIALEQTNTEIRQDIDALGTTESIRKLAWEKLGLVDPDTIIFEDAD